MSFKKIYDALHGFIRLNDLEHELIDSEPFQRLRHLHQLGIAFLVYPGATHTRFEHSLGALHLATRIFDSLFASEGQPFETAYWRQIVRLAALCHDLGHLPFSHDAEEQILGKGGHEAWTLQVIECDALSSLWTKLEQRFPSHTPREDVQKIAVGKHRFANLSPWEELFSEILCGDFFGADRVDYLLRDAKCTGVAHGLFDFDQLMEMLCLVEGERIVLGIHEDGMESCEALLLARYFMHQRVYQYSSVKAYRFHLKRFMTTLYEGKDYLENMNRYLALSDLEVFSALRQAAKDVHAPGHLDALCIFDRKKRFQAIKWIPKILQSDLIALRTELDLSPQQMDWNLALHPDTSMGVNIPVRARTGEIVSATRYSRVKVSLEQPSWIYVLPECASILYKKLQYVSET